MTIGGESTPNGKNHLKFPFWLFVTFPKTPREQWRPWKWCGWYALPSPMQLLCVRQQKQNDWLFLCFSFDICSVKAQNGLDMAKVSHKHWLNLSPWTKLCTGSQMELYFLLNVVSHFKCIHTLTSLWHQHMQLPQFWRHPPQLGDSYHWSIHKSRWLLTASPHLVESFTSIYIPTIINTSTTPGGDR